MLICLCRCHCASQYFELNRQLDRECTTCTMWTMADEWFNRFVWCLFLLRWTLFTRGVRWADVISYLFMFSTIRRRFHVVYDDLKLWTFGWLSSKYVWLTSMRTNRDNDSTSDAITQFLVCAHCGAPKRKLIVAVVYALIFWWNPSQFGQHGSVCRVVSRYVFPYDEAITLRWTNLNATFHSNRSKCMTVLINPNNDCCAFSQHMIQQFHLQ